MTNTGKCHYCGKKIPGLFCNDNCEQKYHDRIKIVSARKREATAERRSNRKGTGYPRGGTLSERIDRVVAKAIERGDCYNMATQAPQ
jgi:hypothetical protein